MNSLIKRYFLGAGLSFVLMTIVCVLLYPEVFRHYEYGISYFGSVPKTMGPYYLGFGLTIFFLVLVALKLRSLHNRKTLPLQLAFWAIVICLSGIAVTSYSVNDMAYAVHWVFAIALTLCIVTVAIWLIALHKLLRLDYALVAAILVTIILSALPIIHTIPYFRVYIPRELLVFMCSLLLLRRATLKAIATLIPGTSPSDIVKTR